MLCTYLWRAFYGGAVLGGGVGGAGGAAPPHAEERVDVERRLVAHQEAGAPATPPRLRREAARVLAHHDARRQRDPLTH